MTITKHSKKTIYPLLIVFRNFCQISDIKYNNFITKRQQKLNEKTAQWKSTKYTTTYAKSNQPMNEVTTNLITKIKNAKKPLQILQLIESNSITDPKIYGISMKECLQLDINSYLYVRKIMDIAISNKNLNTITFNIFFDIIGKMDRFGASVKYFDILLSLNFKLDAILFGTLIKGCKNRSKHLSLAEKYFDYMIYKCKIEPNKHILSEMLLIYGKNQETKKATKLFKKYCINNIHLLDEINWNNYLNVFSVKGDTKSMLKVFNLMKKYMNKNDIGIVTYTNLMKGFINAKEYKECIKLYDVIINNGLQPNGSTYRMLFGANLIGQNKDKINQEKYHNNILIGIPNEMNKYKVEMDFKVWYSFLESYILKYGNNNINKVIKYFEQNIHHFGYLSKCKFDGSYIIQLHGYIPKIARFVLKYVFCYRINELDIDKDLIICVGKGYHSFKDGETVGDAIFDEINKWNPPIKGENMKNNEGRIIIEKEIVKKWLKINKSSDWNMMFNTTSNP